MSNRKRFLTETEAARIMNSKKGYDLKPFENIVMTHGKRTTEKLNSPTPTMILMDVVVLLPPSTSSETVQLKTMKK